jgi:four helix bundle protein
VKYNPREFARYANIAKGSLGELQNDLRQARALGYVSDREYTEGWRLIARAFRATNRLHRYLRTCPHR